MHNVCVIIIDCGCMGHNLAYSVAPKHSKSSCKISARTIKEFTEKVIKKTKIMHDSCQIMHAINTIFID